MTRTSSTVGTLKTKGPHAASHGIDARIMALAVLIQMTWPGSPGIYYADEAGQVGWTDPDSRRTYPWGHENKELIAYHKAVIALRKKIHCIKSGSLKALDSGTGYIAYGRFDKEDCAVVLINCSDESLDLMVPVWEIGVPNGAEMVCKFSFEEGGFSSEESRSTIKFGRLYINLPPKSGKVLSYKFIQE